MLWIIVILAVIFLVFGAAGVRTTLKVGAVLLALAIGGVVLLLLREGAEKEAAKKRISPREVQLELRLGTDNQRSRNWEFARLTGTVRNDSARYTLTSVGLEILLRDCVQEKCDIVGQVQSGIWIDVPPGQQRGVDRSIYFPNLPPRRGEYQWEHRITEVRGKPIAP